MSMMRVGNDIRAKVLDHYKPDIYISFGRDVAER